VTTDDVVVVVVVAGVGLGTVVATVAGVPHAARAKDERRATRDVGFVSNLA
jgi:hypothetical protein